MAVKLGLGDGRLEKIGSNLRMPSTANPDRVASVPAAE